MRIIRLLLAFMAIMPICLHAQTGLDWGKCNTSLAYFDDNKDGYIVMRDGTRMEGEILLKSYEKDGRIQFTNKSGTKYKIDVRSLESWGLNAETPKCYSPLSWFDWKNKKRKENDHPERGFVVLKSGETLDGKIRIEGHSYDGDRAGNDFFALETLTFYAKDGKETVYLANQIKGYGRILPWSFTPSDLYAWQNGEVMGKRKTKWNPGYCIMNDGRRIEGEMQLIVKNKLPSSRNGKPLNANIRSEIVDDIKFRRDGKDETLSMDDIFAYGLSGMTINTLTNNRDRLYNFDEMNFHQGTVALTNNTTKKGYFAYFPEPGNYYGIYFAQKADEPVTIIPMKEIKTADQDIVQIEAFDDGTAPVAGKKNSNSNINGYIVTNQLQKLEGTVTLVEDNDFWVRSIEFTDKDGNKMKYGGTGERIAYFVKGNDLYVQHGSPFMKAEKMGTTYVAYNNPFPDNTSKGAKLGMMLGKAIVQDVVADAATSFQIRNNMSMKGVSINGQRADGLNFGYNVGSAVSDGLMSVLSKSEARKEKTPYKAKRGEDMLIMNVITGESISAKEDDDVEVLLEGCSKYWSAGSSEKKAVMKSGAAGVADYLNAAIIK